MSKISIILLVTLSAVEIYAQRGRWLNRSLTGLRAPPTSQPSSNRSLVPATTPYTLFQDELGTDPQKSLEDGIAALMNLSGPASYAPTSYAPASPSNGSSRDRPIKVWIEDGVMRSQFPVGMEPTEDQLIQILIEDDPDVPNEIASYKRDEYKPLEANTVATGYITPKPEINNGKIEKSLPCGGKVIANISGVTDFHIINRLTKEMRNAITNLCRKEQDPNPQASDGMIAEPAEIHFS